MNRIYFLKLASVADSAFRSRPVRDKRNSPAFQRWDDGDTSHKSRQGRKKIAQRFNAGRSVIYRRQVPLGTKEPVHTFTSIVIHCVWATKNRGPYLTSVLHERLWPYLGGIARENGMKMLAIGGVSDHVHLLISIPPKLAVSKAVQLLKGNSSKWIHELFPNLRAFEWQEGYGAFSIGISAVDATIAYIRNQTEHHRTRTFREEFMSMLQRPGFDYDEWMLD
jgi:Transposase and inactivated derivatives